MKAVISSTFDDQYLFYLPITTWVWNKLGVGVIYFIPEFNPLAPPNKGQIHLVIGTIQKMKMDVYAEWGLWFKAPEHKQATYAQCSRLYAASLDLTEDEILIVGDVDMLFFNKELLDGVTGYFMYVIGNDLVPDGQYPMCYLAGTTKIWREAIGEGTYQEHLDKLLGHIEDEGMRGNYWAKDQEEAFSLVRKVPHVFRPRTNGQNPFATRRLDRDDSYFMDRLSPDIIDYHCHRPGYSDENFEKILSVIKYFYPNDDLTWMRIYRDEYVKLINA